jgi:hypothetical protein
LKHPITNQNLLVEWLEMKVKPQQCKKQTTNKTPQKTKQNKTP